MSPSRPGGGRQRKIVSGGGNAYKRGSGLGTGPVGGGGRPGGSSGSRGGGTRSGGGSLLAILAAILIGKASSSGGGSGGTSRSGCLKRILLIAVVAIVILFLVRMCRSGGTVSDLLGGGLGGMLGDTQTEESGPDYAEPETTLPQSEGSGTGAYDFSSLLGGSNNVYSAPATASAYAAHEPDDTVDASARARYTQLKGNGQDSVTVMVFMCGTDLESSNGMATADLQEMIQATIADNVNLIVETGGASSWRNSTISARTNQIYQVKTGGLRRLEDNLGRKSMVDPDTLSEFIRYCKREFPADRYALILWDHGGGSITGYGYDQLFPNDGSMSLDEINDALKDGGCRFDFIGFDACLMATLETALVSEQYADYLIASEATEPGTGWYYTNWLTRLSANTSMPTVDLAKVIVDDFVSASAQAAANSPATLSLIDLAELHGTVPAKLTAFSEATSAMLDDSFSAVSQARSSAKDFSASSRINQIDLIHFADNLNTESSNALSAALRGCVKYNRCGRSVTNANGVTIYFPYQSLSKVSEALTTYNRIGMNESYMRCIKSFASMAAGGQVASNSSADALGSLLGGDMTGSLLGSLLGSSASDYADYSSASSADAVGALLEAFLGGDRSAVTGDADSSWIEEDRVRASTDYLAANRAGFDRLTLTEAGGNTVLALTEEQWAAVQTLEMNVFVDDGSGYIDLGFDPYAEYDEAGNLIMAYDGNWLSVDGQIIAAYYLSEDRVDDAYTLLYRAPALLNGQRVNLILAITGRTDSGVDEECTLLGAQTDYQASSDAVMKGLTPVQEGDELQFLCDYYGYDGAFRDSYRLGDPVAATAEPVVGYAPLGSAVRWSMCYRLTDTYAARYWTPAITN